MTTARTEQHRPCPKCGGHDRFYLVSQPRSGANAYWKCRQCNYWESADGRTSQPGGEPMEPMTPERYAQSHGATWADFEKAGARWHDRYEWYGKTYPAIWFPEGDGGRIRLFDHPKSKWVPERTGQKPMLWGLERAARLARKAGLPALLLVNGHSSVIPMQAAGIPAFCLPGGEGNIATYLKRGLSETLRAAWDGPILIMLDGDGMGRENAPKVAAALVGAGIPAYMADPGDGMDAADYLKLHGAAAVQSRLADPAAAPADAHATPRTASATSTGSTSKWKLHSYDDLGELPPVQWLIDQRVIADGLTLLYGPSGSGKSFLMLDYAIRVAEANPGRAVVYIAPEGGRGYRKRAEAWARHNRRPIPTNLLWLLNAPRIDDASEHAMLVALLAEHTPILVVIDTLARCAIGLDENSARDMGLFIHGLDQLRQGLAERGADGVGVAVVHHTGKSGTGYRGSSALIAAADVAIELTTDGDLITLEPAKVKDERPFDPQYLRLVEVPEADSCILAPATGRSDERVGGIKIRPNDRKILELVSLDIFSTTGVKWANIQKATGIADTTLFRCLDKLVKAGHITQAEKGDPYYISDSGRKVLSLSITSNGSTESKPYARPSLSSTSTTPLGVEVVEVGSKVQVRQAVDIDDEEAAINADLARIEAYRRERGRT